MTDFNALVEAEVERQARQWERTEERLHKEMERLRERVRALEVMKAVDIRDVPWLVKDFNVLYRVALDVSMSDVRPDEECTPPMRCLRAQLERLAPAFTDTEEVRKAAHK